MVEQTRLNVTLYRVSQEEWTKLQDSVPYVKIYRYNPKHLYPKFNGYGDNGPEKFESMTAVTHLLITKFVSKLAGKSVSVILISVLNIKLTCE